MNTAYLPMVRALPSNHQGRDFVVGDLHGCFDLLDRLLDHARFDPSCDRLFSVGDLVDRGPDSLRCMEFLEMPWFYAVKGNHEIMLLDFFGPYLASGRMDSWHELRESDLWLNGGEWVESCYQHGGLRMTSAFDQLLERLHDLPLIWVVGEGTDRFHVLHAELVRAGYHHSHQEVWLDDDIDRWQAGEAIDYGTRRRLSWGRTLMGTLARHNVPPVQEGLSTTYCGHTIADRVRNHLSHVCLDTGAYKSRAGDSLDADRFGLTLYSVREQRHLWASYGGVSVIETPAPSSSTR